MKLVQIQTQAKIANQVHKATQAEQYHRRCSRRTQQNQPQTSAQGNEQRIDIEIYYAAAVTIHALCLTYCVCSNKRYGGNKHPIIEAVLQNRVTKQR